MKCWRIDLWPKMAAYAHGFLSGEELGRMEDHLTECDSCRRRLSRVRQGDQLARNLPAFTAPENAWVAIQAAIEKHPLRKPHPPMRLRVVATALGALAAALVVFITWNGGLVTGGRNKTAGFDSTEYRTVPLSGIPDNREPHVVTEGYVAKMKTDEDDGDLIFKLVDNPKSPNHFVVCEIIDPVRMQVPAAGSYIRVYGVSRYDAKPGHQWFEVHPVLGIQSMH